MWNAVLHDTLRRAVKEGALEVTYPDGVTRRYGPGHEARATPIRIALADPSLPRRMLLNADLALGEGYVEGGLRVEDLRGFMDVAARASEAGDDVPALRLYKRVARTRQALAPRLSAGAARRNVAHHYDLSPALYDLFLDAERHYSCAYFERPGMGLEEAQRAKVDHIARKLLLRPGLRVLDVGCGWGSLALRLARVHRVHVTGVTLSEEQLAHARERAAREGLSDRVEFRLQDYRRVPERFDRVVSVGMFEHVGQAAWPAYFEAVRERLAPDGVALIHTIGRNGPPGNVSPWIRRYIFPGGQIPALSEMMAVVERARLVNCDVEVWRMHYAETLRHWLARFEARADEAERLYDARFVRMWRWYLAGCEANFRRHRQVVFQVQLARSRDVVPITRSYMHREAAREMEAAE